MTGLRRRALGRVLVTSVAEHSMGTDVRAVLARLSQPEVDHLLLAAARHGVTGFLSRALLPLPDVDHTLRHALQEADSRLLRDHLRGLSEFAVVAEALDRLDTPWLTFKGPSLAQLTYSQPRLREYCDIDVMVPATAVRDALRVLADAGCRWVDGDWADIERERAGEVKLLSPGGVLIDLHWELCNDWRVRDAFRLPPTSELFRRGRRMSLVDRDVLTLDVVDTLLHVALHACTSGGWRLLWLKDTTQAIRASAGHEEEVVSRARSWHVDLVLAAMAERAERVLGTTTSAALHEDLGRRSPWLRLLVGVDALTPVERNTGQGSLTRIVTNSTRRDTTRSAAELLRRSAAFAGHTGIRRPGWGLSSNS